MTMIFNPNRHIRLLFWMFLFTKLAVRGQQIVYLGENELYSPAFDALYMNRGEIRLSEECQHLVQQNRVKKMSLYDSKGALFYFFEFDNKGSVCGEGYFGRRYFTVKRAQQSGAEKVTTRAYYLGPWLMRADTESVLLHAYKNADTSLSYTESRTTVYKRGVLINEQNFFYNTNYFNRSQRFRVDYDTSSLYLCAKIDTAGKFEGDLRQGFINLSSKFLKDHAFYKKFLEAETLNYYVEGESFVEPVGAPFWFCGTRMEDVRQREETQHKNGLFDSCYYVSYGERQLSFYARYEYYAQQD